MNSVLSSSRTLLLAAAVAGIFAPPWPVTAQPAPSSPAPAAAPPAPATAQTPTPPPSWMQGAPSAAEESHLAPQVPPPIPTPIDKLPVAGLKLPKNFHLEVFASGLANARSLRIDDKGTVFVSTRTLGRVYCDEFTKPVAQLGPHSAPLGLRFYTGHMFPREYDNALFIVRHGSWNKTKKIGGDIVVAKLNADGSVKSIQPFISGFLQDNKYVGRPVDVELMKDGSMLISDDWNGAVYRLTYGLQRVSARR